MDEGTARTETSPGASASGTAFVAWRARAARLGSPGRVIPTARRGEPEDDRERRAHALRELASHPRGPRTDLDNGLTIALLPDPRGNLVEVDGTHGSRRSGERDSSSVAVDRAERARSTTLEYLSPAFDLATFPQHLERKDFDADPGDTVPPNRWAEAGFDPGIGLKVDGSQVAAMRDKKQSVTLGP